MGGLTNLLENKERKKYTLKLCFFIFLISYFIIKFLFFTTPHLSGDGFEYALMLESWFNHFSPDATKEDFESLRQIFLQNNYWTEWWEEYFFRPLTAFFAQNQILSDSCGYFIDLSGDRYSYHFWLYSLLNLPARFILHLAGSNPLGAFQWTNLVFIAITSFILLFRSKLSFLQSVILISIFIFSAIYWYITWSGPEIFCSCLVLLGFVYYYEEKYYLSVLFTSIAAIHFPSFIILSLFFAIGTLIKKKFNIKAFFLLGLSGIWFILPPLFYYLNFNIPNLILYKGFINENHFTPDRVFSLFFDLNQGMILGIPIVLFIFIYTYSRNLYNHYKSWKYELLIFPFIFLMIPTFINMNNWNAGCAVVNRYALWTSIPIIGYTILNIDFKNNRFMTPLLGIAIVMQFIAVEYKGLDIAGHEFVRQNRFTNWIIINYPSLYNPIPEIFAERTMWNEGIGPKESPIVYRDENNNIRKIMVHISTVHTLPAEYASPEELQNLRFVEGWAYINK